MSFELTKAKIEEAQIHIRSLDNIHSFPEYRSKFSASLESLCSIWDTLKSEGKSYIGFNLWKENKWNVIESDPLLHAAREWRRLNYHTGESPLLSIMENKTQVISNNAVNGDLPIVLGNEGIFRIKNSGLVDEERIPANDISHSVHLSIKNCPTSHLGNKIEGMLPDTILLLILSYYKTIYTEAATKWPD